MSRGPHQAERPRGLAGIVMEAVLRRSNARQNAVTVDHLALRPAARVLEIGFGPGDALERIAATGPALLAGADHSRLMVARTGRRLARRLAPDRLELKVADAADLPFGSGRFDLVFAVNSFHQWSEPVAAMAESRRVLRPGGRLLLSVRVFKRDGGFETPARGHAAADAAQQALQANRFDAITRTDLDLGDRWAALIQGRAPA